MKRAYIYILLALTLSLISGSCSDDNSFEQIDPREVPVQMVYDVEMLQSDRGDLSVRMTSPYMERFEYVQDSIQVSYESYPQGFYVYAFAEDSQLETYISAKGAKHVTTPKQESWALYGDVEVINYIKGEMISTDTLYWNQEAKQIHTDCYVKISSYSGFMQGYGMESDERARNALIKNPFDSYSILRDSTDFYIDSVNFVGPLVQRF